MWYLVVQIRIFVLMYAVAWPVAFFNKFEFPAIIFAVTTRSRLVSAC